MNYRQLGQSGLVVSELALGTMTFGEGDFYGLNFTFDQTKADQLVNTALDKGINFFDTADLYGNGECESILGKALGKNRSKAVIATKYSFRAGASAFDAGVNAKHLIQQTEKSLKNLNTDYLDLVLLHIDDPITPIDETLRTLETLVQKGMIRYIGLSNYQAWKAATMIQRQKDLNYQPFTASQMHYSILNREVEHEFIPMSLHHGLGMMAWSPLSGGFLTGKYTRENPAPADARLNTFDLGLFDRELAYDVVDKIKIIADENNVDPTAIAIAWLLSKQVVSSVIVGVSKLSQLDSNVEATTVSLTDSEIADLDQLTEPKLTYPKSFMSMQDEILRKAAR